MKKRTKILSAVGAVVAAVGLTGVSWAYYTEKAVAEATGGQGADLKAVEVVDTPTYVYDNADGLYPGHKATVKIKVKNPNGVPVTVNSVTNTDEVITGSQDDPYCKGQLAVVVTPSFNTGPDPIVIPAKGTVTLTLTDAISLEANTDNRCQGMTFDLKYDVLTTNN